MQVHSPESQSGGVAGTCLSPQILASLGFFIKTPYGMEILITEVRFSEVT